MQYLFDILLISVEELSNPKAQLLYWPLVDKYVVSAIVMEKVECDEIANAVTLRVR